VAVITAPPRISGWGWGDQVREENFNQEMVQSLQMLPIHWPSLQKWLDYLPDLVEEPR